MQRLLLFVALWLLTAQLNASTPVVVVTIKPLQLIAAAIVDGVIEGDAEVRLLLDPRQSHHDYQLRPSDRLLLQRADVVFWIGPELESFLRRPLAALSDEKRVVSLSSTAAKSGVHHAEGHDHHHGVDAHYWLAPPEVVRMGYRMATVLAELMPEREADLMANAQRFESRVTVLDRELAATWKGQRDAVRPYLVMHDAYGHFEQRYGLTRAATYAETPEHQPGARQIVALRDQMARGQIQCVLREPQYRAGPLEAALADFPEVAVVDLDLLGVDVRPTPDSYLRFMRAFAAAFRSCLSTP